MISEAEKVKLKGIKDEVIKLLKVRYYFNYLTILLSNRIAIAFVLSLLPFYGEYVLMLSATENSFLIGGVLGVGIFAIPVWNKILVKFKTKKTMLLSLASSLLAILVVIIISSKLGSILVISILGACFAGTQLVLSVMGAEVVDKDTTKNKKNRAGMLYGIQGFTLRFPPAIVGLLIGEVLRVSGYDANLARDLQPLQLATNLKLLFVAGITLSIALTYLATLRYRDVDYDDK